MISMNDILKSIETDTLLALIDHEERLRLRDRAKTNFLDYCEYVHEGLFKRTRHAEVICNTIQDALTESKRIMDKVKNGEQLKEDEGVVVVLISMPPQHGKSMAIAETLPSYFLGHNPDLTALLISYNQNSARKFGRRNRYKIGKYSQELFNVSLDDSNSSVEEFGISDRIGTVQSIGINGSITGKSGNLIIVDDPYKNGKDANSPVIRNHIQTTVEDSVLTRIHPGSLLVVVHTRWHEDDLIAYLKGVYKGRAKVLSISAECEDSESDPLHRQVGEYLWADHHGIQYYEDRKKNARVWSALYQQRPAPTDGAIFSKSNFRSYDKSLFCIGGSSRLDYSQFRYLVMSWDCTFEGNTTSDFVVCHIWGYKDGNYYLLYRFKRILDFVTSHDKIYDVIKGFPAVKTKLIEKKANGHAIINSLERVHKVKNIIGISPSQSKYTRAENVAYVVNNGNVFLPEDDETIDEMISEFGNFPFGKHDDEVDAFTQAISYIEDKVNSKSKPIFGRSKSNG